MIIGYSFTVLIVKTIEVGSDRLTALWRQGIRYAAGGGLLGSKLAL
jgi:hypothetical protein